MRLAIGAVAVLPAVASASRSATLVSAGAALAGAAIGVGVMTPLAGMALAVLAATGAAGLAAVPWSTAEALLVGATALAVVLLGPGAYSVDARLFGRREVMISHAPRR